MGMDLHLEQNYFFKYLFLKNILLYLLLEGRIHFYSKFDIAISCSTFVPPLLYIDSDFT